MEQQVKTIRIKEGKVWVSPMVEPKIPTGGLFTTVMFWPEYENWIKDADAYNASFVEVENPEAITGFPFSGLHKLADGDYPAPEGLTMEVKYLEKGRSISTPFGTDFPDGKRIAVVSFSEKECKPCGEGDNVCNCKSKSECGYIYIGEQIEKLAAEKEEKPDFEIIDNAETTGEVIITWKTDVGKLKEANIQLQQEITTLREQVLHFQKLSSKYLGENRELTDQYNALGVKYDKELERWQERDTELRARIAELEKKQ